MLFGHVDVILSVSPAKISIIAGRKSVRFLRTERITTFLCQLYGRLDGKENFHAFYLNLSLILIEQYSTQITSWIMDVNSLRLFVPR
jgi:hypothetical protein